MCIFFITANAFAIEDTKGIKLPIIMYHSVLKDSKRSGDYVISTTELENDLVYLKLNGYKTLLMSDVFKYVYEGIELPEKCVMLTFDDVFRNSLVYVLPLLEKYNMKANVSVVGYYTEKFSDLSDNNPAYAYLTYDDILELKRSGLIEIGNHSFNMHTCNYKRKGVTKNKDETIEKYTDIFIRDTFTTENNLYKKCGIKPQFYVYPFGFYCNESEEILKSLGYKSTFICCEKQNYLTREPSCLYKLNRYNRPSGISSEDFFEKVLK